MYEKTIDILKKIGVNYKEIKHEVIFHDHKAAKVKKIFSLEGIETKTLLLKTKREDLYAFTTIEAKKLYPSIIKKLLNERIAMASSEEILLYTGCFPGCVAPFGYAKEISLIVDSEIFQYDKLIFSPGVPMKTVEITTADFSKLLKKIDNKVMYFFPSRN
ncbi:regulatory protein [Clostridium aceticum]|uniref:Regulatory protein n=1 Tax=Clostridium aceticum TaxID=84022 RepID=A0A0D8IF17_9CLOT|nr:YbaK/EbsC family protein [Clostridium aceticum]AKL94879.1 regulatory protein [Clostridium aceticum]KJF27806.1 hypothetical protein TZ02_04180 [Clostridium aceticum]